MKTENVILEIEKLLDEWDPIGILQDSKRIVYIEGVRGEYTKYAEEIEKNFNHNNFNQIDTYLNDLYFYLSGVKIDEKYNEELNKLTNKIVDVLYKFRF